MKVSEAVKFSIPATLSFAKMHRHNYSDLWFALEEPALTIILLLLPIYLGRKVTIIDGEK